MASREYKTINKMKEGGAPCHYKYLKISIQKIYIYL